MEIEKFNLHEVSTGGILGRLSNTAVVAVGSITEIRHVAAWPWDGSRRGVFKLRSAILVDKFSVARHASEVSTVSFEDLVSNLKKASSTHQLVRERAALRLAETAAR